MKTDYFKHIVPTEVYLFSQPISQPTFRYRFFENIRILGISTITGHHRLLFAQVLDLSDNYQLCFSPSAFRRFGNTLVHLKLSHISNVTSQRKRHLAPVDMFVTLFKLEILEFTYSNLTDGEMWRFPINLRKLVLDGNQYTYIDVSTNYKLEEISANDNKLKKLPIIYQAPVYVSKYSLKNNPLDDFTVNDLAPLCNLDILELKIPQGAFLTTPIGNCRCRQIIKWTELFNISTTLACSHLTGNYFTISLFQRFDAITVFQSFQTHNAISISTSISNYANRVPDPKT